VKALSEKPRLDPEKVKELQERTRERNLILKVIKDHGPSTVDELSKATSMEKSKLVKHLVAMRIFGKVAVVGERDSQLVYSLPEENM